MSSESLTHTSEVMGDDLKDDECSVVYRAVNRSWKDDDNLGINYSDFVTWIECTVRARLTFVVPPSQSCYFEEYATYLVTYLEVLRVAENEPAKNCQ